MQLYPTHRLMTHLIRRRAAFRPTMRGWSEVQSFLFQCCCVSSHLTPTRASYSYITSNCCRPLRHAGMSNSPRLGSVLPFFFVCLSVFPLCVSSRARASHDASDAAPSQSRATAVAPPVQLLYTSMLCSMTHDAVRPRMHVATL